MRRGRKGGYEGEGQVLVVRQDLKMKSGKITSQCAHRNTGMYAELMYSDRSLLRQWEDCGQPKIVVTCRNQQEMNKLREAAENIGLPTFVVADAGRTQVFFLINSCNLTIALPECNGNL
ncbi:peptidyl-tRNA hydrolase 2, mitochondrial-like [Hibiscus syriacus]|uniref:peptidyl-tRNA hydrolase 2, mitochondrial-like n=1 Tax=Hibiscus syriacus TaxID=106335 RepID=UPI0019240787|nr:peptidyl-tRNA hydrolase 2, mitochondrial-like [Hibiscus syriacus]